MDERDGGAPDSDSLRVGSFGGEIPLQYLQERVAPSPVKMAAGLPHKPFSSKPSMTLNSARKAMRRRPRADREPFKPRVAVDGLCARRRTR